MLSHSQQECTRTPNIIELKRETFRIKIRKENNEKQFRNIRFAKLQNILQQQQQTQQNENYNVQKIVLTLRDKLNSNEELSQEEFETLIGIISKNMNCKDEQMRLLDTLDAAIWLLKSSTIMLTEEFMVENEVFQEVLFKMCSYAQGYYEGPAKECSQQIIVYAAKFLKYFTRCEIDQEYETIVDLLNETVFFLLNKTEEVLVKCGINILYNLVGMVQDYIITKVYQIQHGHTNIAKLLFRILRNNEYNTKLIQKTWEIVCDTLYLAPESCFDQYIDLADEIQSEAQIKQQIPFIGYFIENITGNNYMSRTLLVKQLKAISSLLDNANNKQLLQLQQELSQTDFKSHLHNNWLFSNHQKVSLWANEINESLQ